MEKKLKIAFFCLVALGIVTLSLLFYFSRDIVVLHPKGLIGKEQSSLLFFSTMLMLCIVIPVFILTILITWRYRASNKKAEYRPDWNYSFWAEFLWWTVPTVMMLILGVVTYQACHTLDPFKPLASDVKPLRVQVVALQWKWLFIYPEQNVASLNFAQFPVNVPLDFEITADAPMNSFWIPGLGGQVYAMPGMRAELHLITDTPDTFRGASANISGEGFASMTFQAVAGSQEEFDAWVASAAQSGSLLTLEEYNNLVKPSSYVAAATYQLAEPGLFDAIIMKYMKPMSEVSRMDHAISEPVSGP